MTAPTRHQRRTIIFLLVLSITFVTLDYRSGSMAGIRSAAQTVFGPVQRGLTAVFAPVGRFFSGVPDVGRSHRRIQELEQQNADLQRRLRESELASSRSEELQRLKLLAGTAQFRVVPATVISVGPSLGFEWTLSIDVGSQDGVKPDMTVVNGDGLVGRVTHVTASTAVVLLASDPGSTVGVRLAGSNRLGLASGGGLGPLGFVPLDPQTRVKVGDRLVTGPYQESTYVAGIPVGEVIAIAGDPDAPALEAQVRPYVTVSALDLVGVVLVGPRTDPRDSLLPARPTAGATSTPVATRPVPATASPLPAGTPTTPTTGRSGTP
jgi:rod shape-determining protein MreC